MADKKYLINNFILFYHYIYWEKRLKISNTCNKNIGIFFTKVSAWEVRKAEQRYILISYPNTIYTKLVKKKPF